MDILPYKTIKTNAICNFFELDYTPTTGTRITKLLLGPLSRARGRKLSEISNLIDHPTQKYHSSPLGGAATDKKKTAAPSLLVFV